MITLLVAAHSRSEGVRTAIPQKARLGLEPVDNGAAFVNLMVELFNPIGNGCLDVGVRVQKPKRRRNAVRALQHSR